MNAPIDPPTRPTSSTPAGPASPAGWPLRHVLTLFGFLALFLSLIIAFREVLFPFLMAIFLAYLVEPVVAWVARGKRLGLRWGRGPTLVLMYVIVLVGAFLVVSCGVAEGRGHDPADDPPAEDGARHDECSGRVLRPRAGSRPDRDSGAHGTRARLRRRDAATVRDRLRRPDRGRPHVDPGAPRSDRGRGSRARTSRSGAALTIADRAKLQLPKDRETGAEIALAARVGEAARRASRSSSIAA